MHGCDLGKISGCEGYPLPPRSLGIMELGGNRPKIHGAQSVTGKILENKGFFSSLFAFIIYWFGWGVKDRGHGGVCGESGVEVKSQKSEVRRQKAEGRRQKAEGRRQKSEVRSQKAEDNIIEQNPTTLMSRPERF